MNLGTYNVSTLLAAGYGSDFGSRETWGDVQVGMAGARNAVSNLTFPPSPITRTTRARG